MSDKDNISNRFKYNKEKSVNEPEIKPLKFSKDLIESANTKVTEAKEINSTDIQDEYKSALLEKIETIPVWFEYTKEKQEELVKNFIDKKTEKDKITITNTEKEELFGNLINSISGFGDIQYLLDNERVSSVEINGTASVYIEIDGKFLDTEIKLAEKQLNFILNLISASTGVENFDNIHNFNVDNYEITIVGKDICNSGINIIIKKQNNAEISDLINKGILTEDIYSFILSAIKDRKSIIISGGINTYKTILLSALIQNSDIEKRIFLLEKNIQIKNKKNNITSFCIKSQNENYEELISFIQKSEPEYIITDLNNIDVQISKMKGKLVTLRAESIEDSLKMLISSYINAGVTEKYAKTMALTDYDYIIQLNKKENGIVKIYSIVELSPEKTMSLSVKPILKDIEKKSKKTAETKKNKPQEKSETPTKNLSSRFPK